MRNRTRILALLLCVCMAVGMLTGLGGEAKAVTIDQLKSKYPHGGRWTGAYYNANGSAVAWECYGYAYTIAKEIYGGDPYTEWKNTISVARKGKAATQAAVDNLKAGDIVTYLNGGHTFFVTGVDGQTVTYTDCNNDRRGGIRWDQTITKSTIKSTVSVVDPAPYAWVSQTDTTYNARFWLRKTDPDKGPKVTTANAGEYVYCWYELYGEQTGRQLNEIVKLDYTVQVRIYNPNGSLATSAEYDSRWDQDSLWIGFVPGVAGTYRMTITLTGVFNNDMFETTFVVKSTQQRNTVTMYYTSRSANADTDKSIWVKKGNTIYIHFKLYDKNTGDTLLTYDSSPIKISLKIYKKDTGKLIYDIKGDNMDWWYCPLDTSEMETGEYYYDVLCTQNGRKYSARSSFYISEFSYNDLQIGFLSMSSVGGVTYAFTTKGIKVSFDANDGFCGVTYYYTDDNGVLADLPVPSRDGYNFVGWFTDKTGGTKVTIDTKFTKNTTVYAHWSGGPGVSYGDINGDGKINSKDLTLLGRYVANEKKYPLSAEELQRADINRDGKVNSKDLTLLNRYNANPKKYPLP